VRIAISPDENPDDSGSVSASGVTERSVNLRVAYALRDALSRCGQDVWFDPTITYVERVRIANRDGTSLLVACAHNESTPGLSGTQFVFCPGGAVWGQQGEAARNVMAELAMIPGWPRRRADAIEAVYECCEFSLDTVYIEYLFMSPEDEYLWSQPGYAMAAAEATARGLARTYGFAYVPSPDQVPAGSAGTWWWDASG
jgi:N-acetylmuramoyl-L-alanine amidase